MRSWPPGREKTTLQQSIYRHDTKSGRTPSVKPSASIPDMLAIATRNRFCWNKSNDLRLFTEHSKIDRSSNSCETDMESGTAKMP